MRPGAQIQTDDLNSLALALIEASSAPVVLLDSGLSIIAISNSFRKAFQIRGEVSSGRGLEGLGSGEWDSAQMKSLLAATLSGFADVEAYEMDLHRNGLPVRHLVLNAHRLRLADEERGVILLTVVDMTDVREAEKRKDDLLLEKSILLQEMQHRVANSLQIIASILMQSARRLQSEETRLQLHDAHHRVMSVATLQRQLAGSGGGDVELRPYFTELCRSIAASMIHDPRALAIEVTSDNSVTKAGVSVTLGLIITELVINSLKHAFPSGRAGRIRVDYRSDGRAWTLSVADDGVGMHAGSAMVKPGLGTGIVDALAHHLDAVVSVTDAAPGTKVSVVHA